MFLYLASKVWAWGTLVGVLSVTPSGKNPTTIRPIVLERCDKNSVFLLKLKRTLNAPELEDFSDEGSCTGKAGKDHPRGQFYSPSLSSYEIKETKIKLAAVSGPRVARSLGSADGTFRHWFRRAWLVSFCPLGQCGDLFCSAML